MTSTNPETGETIGGRSPRFMHWCALLVFATITMGASVEERNTNSGSSSSIKDQRWSIFCSAATFTLSIIVVLMHLHPIGATLIIGTKVEGLLILVLTAFWTATVSIVSDARHGLAVDESGVVTNGNLYYFSWAGFVCAIMMCVSFLRGVFGVDVVGEFKGRSERLTPWSALLACQMIVMGTCANIFDQDCTPIVDVPVAFCTRTKFGIAIGCIGVAFSLAIVGIKIATSSAPFMLESLFAIILTILNGFGVAYLTSAKGPGTGLGNLYYFSWGSLLVSVMLCVSVVEQRNSARPAPQDAGNGEIPVEPLDSDGGI